MKLKLISFLLFLALIKAILWAGITPIFQIPDEPSHFSLIQTIAETGKKPHPRAEKKTPVEILKVSEIINFNWQINHPVWQGYQSNWQQKITNLPKDQRSITDYNKHQTSLKRPPLFYYLATPIYLMVKNQSFLIRFFSLRAFSILISLVSILLAFKTSKLLFKQIYLALAITSLVAFQPTFSFITSGVHYDPLAIFIATLFLYLSIKFIKTKQSLLLKLNFLVLVSGLLIKPDLIVLALVYPFLLPKNKLKIFAITGLALISGFAIFYHYFYLLIKSSSSAPIADKFLYLINLNEYSQQASFFVSSFFSRKIFGQLVQYLSSSWQTTLAQVFPWYWGVFGWLEKTMPTISYSIIKLITVLSLTGWLKYFLTNSKNKILTKFQKQSLSFLILTSIAHFALVFLNDFITFASSGRYFGVQGRYFLPMISAHMILLVFGLTQFIPKKFYPIFSLLIILLSLTLNLVGFYSLINYFGIVWL